MSYQLKLAAGFAIGALLLLAAEIRYGLRGAGNLVLACLAGLAAGQLAPEHYWALFGAAGTLVLLLCTWSSAELKGVAYWLIALVWTSITYYLIAPSAEHIVAVIQAWSTRRAQAGQ